MPIRLCMHAPSLLPTFSPPPLPPLTRRRMWLKPPPSLYSHTNQHFAIANRSLWCSLQYTALSVLPSTAHTLSNWPTMLISQENLERAWGHQSEIYEGRKWRGGITCAHHHRRTFLPWENLHWMYAFLHNFSCEKKLNDLWYYFPLLHFWWEYSALH